MIAIDPTTIQAVGSWSKNKEGSHKIRRKVLLFSRKKTNPKEYVSIHLNRCSSESFSLKNTIAASVSFISSVFANRIAKQGNDQND